MRCIDTIIAPRGARRCAMQHGLVDGRCAECRLMDQAASNLNAEQLGRVLSRVNRHSARPEFGSTPHHERVLPVVLVMPGRIERGEDEIRVVLPGSPHWDAFWQDIGRPEEGQGRTAEAPETGERVQPACPTGCGHCAERLDPHSGTLVCPGCPNTASAHRLRRHITPDPVPGPYVYRWRGWHDARVLREIADRCNDFWRDRHADRLERIGPQPEPYSREGN